MSCTADQTFKIFGVFPKNFRGCVFTFYLQTKILRLLFYLLIILVLMQNDSQ